MCTKCELTFKTFMDYHQHKMRSRRHITCEVCSQDFESHEACKQHHDLVRSPLQLQLRLTPRRCMPTSRISIARAAASTSPDLEV